LHVRSDAGGCAYTDVVFVFLLRKPTLTIRVTSGLSTSMWMKNCSSNQKVSSYEEFPPGVYFTAAFTTFFYFYFRETRWRVWWQVALQARAENARRS